MWPLARNLKIPFPRPVSKRHMGLPVYATIHAHRLRLKKERKKKTDASITQACSLKIHTSSLWACAGFFSLILTAFFTKKKYPFFTPEKDLTHHAKSGLLQLFSCVPVERCCWLIFMSWPCSFSALSSALNEHKKLPKHTSIPNTPAKNTTTRIFFFFFFFFARKAQLRYIIWFPKRSCLTQFYCWVSKARGGQDTCRRSVRANSWVWFRVPCIPLHHQPLRPEQHYVLMLSLVSVVTSFLSKDRLLWQLY